MKYRLKKPWGIYKAGEVIETASLAGAECLFPKIPGMCAVTPEEHPDWFEPVDELEVMVSELENYRAAIEEFKKMDAELHTNPNDLFYGEGKVVMAANAVTEAWRSQRDAILTKYNL